MHDDSLLPFAFPAVQGKKITAAFDGGRRSSDGGVLLLREAEGRALLDRKLNATDVIDVLSDMFIPRGRPEHVRSDNGPEFVAEAVQQWIAAVGTTTAYIAPCSPRENGFVEPFIARLHDELFDGEIFYTLREAQLVVESWRHHFDTVRPHGSLGYEPPAPEVFVPAMVARASAKLHQASPPALASRPSIHYHCKRTTPMRWTVHESVIQPGFIERKIVCAYRRQ